MDPNKKPELPPCAVSGCVALVIAEGFHYCAVHVVPAYRKA